jgi:hypothetical protein
LQRRGIWLCKSKTEKRVLKKIDKCPNYQNNGYLDARLKKEKKEIAHVVLQSYLQVLKKRGMFARSKSRINLAPIYTPTTIYPHTCRS